MLIWHILFLFSTSNLHNASRQVYSFCYLVSGSVTVSPEMSSGINKTDLSLMIEDGTMALTCGIMLGDYLFCFGDSQLTKSPFGIRSHPPYIPTRDHFCGVPLMSSTMRPQETHVCWSRTWMCAIVDSGNSFPPLSVLPKAPYMWLASSLNLFCLRYPQRLFLASSLHIWSRRESVNFCLK